jgi:hypothetical protein
MSFRQPKWPSGYACRVVQFNFVMLQLAKGIGTRSRAIVYLAAPGRGQYGQGAAIISTTLVVVAAPGVIPLRRVDAHTCSFTQSVIKVLQVILHGDNGIGITGISRI